MEDQNLKSIQVNVGSQVLPLKVTPDDESRVREVARALSRQITELEVDYRVDKLTAVSMVLLQTALDQSIASSSAEDQFSVQDVLTRIEAAFVTH